MKRFDYLQEIDCLCEIEKFNPYHDHLGRFAPAPGSGGANPRQTDLSQAQHYRAIEFGEATTRERGTAVLQGRKVESSDFDVWVSDKVTFSRRSQHILNKELTTAFEALPKIDGAVKPEVLVMDPMEIMRPMAAAYNPVQNTLYVNAAIFEKSTRAQLDGDYVGGTRLETTFYHEALHWHDAWKFKAAGGTITKANYADYLETQNRKAKKRLDSAGVTEDNVNKISDYAQESYKKKNFDEVYTEYRVLKRFRKV
ncbi:MAG: hypothetical protein Q4C56_06890 [Peptococcaceae bacterium]|nr:hypothetical protein [Peptococcaceae bacterium]